MGCVSSRLTSSRRKSSTVEESSEKRIDSSSSRIDDWIQPDIGFESSQMFSSNRFYDDHQIMKMEKKKKNPDIVVVDHMNQETVVNRGLEVIDGKYSKIRLLESEKSSSKSFLGHHQIEKKPESTKIESLAQTIPPELRIDEKQSSKTFYDHHKIDKQPESPKVEALAQTVTRESKQVAAGWPSWLVLVASEALVDWAPRRASTFEKMEKIGSGTYSNVYRARDLIHNKIVALKKVRFDLKDMESVKFMAREIIVMRRLDHPNVLKLEGLITASVSSSLYLVFEYMDHDLLGLSSLPGVRFSEPQVKCYMQQLLSGLEHCHSRGVLHRDIKGSNLLIDSNGVLKIADFGLATFFDPANTVPLTSHVVTLWYRPPELLLGASYYGVGVDLWSTGCILAELYAGKPILPGKTEVEQLHKIFKLCGSPAENYCRKLKLPPSAAFKPAIPYRRKLSEIYKNFPSSVLSLLETLLSIDPDHRNSAYNALESEYFKTKPFACDPSYLPKYPPSKEIDAQKRDDAKRQRPVRAEKQQEKREDSSQTTRKSYVLPAIKANQSLTMTMEKQYQDLRTRNDSFKSFKKEKRTSHGPQVPDYLNMQYINNQSGVDVRVSHSGPLMSKRNKAKSTMHVKENAPPPLRYYPTSRVNPKKSLSSSVSFNSLLQDQQPVPTHRRRDRRAYNRADTMDSRHMTTTTPIDPSWYNPSDSKIYMSGPLLAQPSRVDQMLEEHDQQVQEFNRQQAQKS